MCRGRCYDSRCTLPLRRCGFLVSANVVWKCRMDTQNILGSATKCMTPRTYCEAPQNASSCGWHPEYCEAPQNASRCGWHPEHTVKHHKMHHIVDDTQNIPWSTTKCIKLWMTPRTYCEAPQNASRCGCCPLMMTPRILGSTTKCITLWMTPRTYWEAPQNASRCEWHPEYTVKYHKMHHIVDVALSWWHPEYTGKHHKMHNVVDDTQNILHDTQNIVWSTTKCMTPRTYCEVSQTYREAPQNAWHPEHTVKHRKMHDTQNILWSTAKCMTPRTYCEAPQNASRCGWHPETYWETPQNAAHCGCCPLMMTPRILWSTTKCIMLWMLPSHEDTQNILWSTTNASWCGWHPEYTGKHHKMHHVVWMTPRTYWEAPQNASSCG